MFAFLTQLLLPWEQCFIDFDNDELAGGTTLIQRTIVPCWKDAIRFGSIICHTKSKKQWWRWWLICWWWTFYQQEEAIGYNGCKKCIEQWWAYAYSSHGKLTAKMIHSAIWECKRFVLNDGQLLHMVKLLVLLGTSVYILSMYKLMWKMAPDLCG